jgi:hypothetical protein
MRPLKKVRAMAANSAGDLFIVDDDYNRGLLRCKAGATDCAPWPAMPLGELASVKVGASDFVYVLDNRLQSVRVLDDNGRQMASLGLLIDAAPAAFAAGTPNAVSVKYEFKRIADFAVDQTYTVYLLDPQQRKIGIVPLKLDGDKLVPEVKGVLDLPNDDKNQFFVKNPSAIAVTPSGALIVAGQSPRVVRYR